jgi:hypothetical protein
MPGAIAQIAGTWWRLLLESSRRHDPSYLSMLRVFMGYKADEESKEHTKERVMGSMNSIEYAPGPCGQELPGQSRRGKGPAQGGTGMSATQVASSHHLHFSQGKKEEAK